VQDVKSFAFVPASAALGASAPSGLGPRSVSCLRSTTVHNPLFVPTPKDSAPFPGVSWRRGTTTR
jgi:hypothetical protein